MAHSILCQISQSVHNTHYAIMADEVTAGADLGGGGFVGLQPPQNIWNQKIIFNF